MGEPTPDRIQVLNEQLRAEPDNAVVAAQLAERLLESRPGQDWRVLKPDEMTSAGGATLTRLADGSILAAGNLPVQDSYTITASTELRGITAVRLEALPDTRLPQNGPGRNSGNFCLTEISLVVESAGASGKRQSIPFARAAGYRRPLDRDTTFMDGPQGAIDGRHTTRWDIWPRAGEETAIVVQTMHPVALSEGMRLVLRLDFRHPVFSPSPLGRFRLAVTNQPHPAHDENLRLLGERVHGRARLGLAHVLRGEGEKALAVLSRSAAGVSGGSGVEDLLVVLGNEQLGRRSEADSAYDRLAESLRRVQVNSHLLELAVEAASRRIARDPKNGTWWLQRARWQLRCGYPKQAMEDFTQAQELDPKLDWQVEDVPVLGAVEQAMTFQLAWKEVAVCQEHLLRLRPDQIGVWYGAAVVQAQMGNREAWRRICRGMLTRFGTTKNWAIAQQTAVCCLLLPGEAEDLKKVTEMLDRQSKDKPEAAIPVWFRLTRGMAEYRAGRFAEAAGWLEKAGKLHPYGQIQGGFLLAMIQHRREQAEAGRTLARTREFHVSMRPLDQNDISWTQWLINDVLRREAEGLIENKTEDRK
jgi:tetratricopeptide (TPR) repeat protein